MHEQTSMFVDLFFWVNGQCHTCWSLPWNSLPRKSRNSRVRLSVGGIFECQILHVRDYRVAGGIAMCQTATESFFCILRTLTNDSEVTPFKPFLCLFTFFTSMRKIPGENTKLFNYDRWILLYKLDSNNNKLF